jgi:transcription antitermination factor NusG
MAEEILERPAVGTVERASGTPRQLLLVGTRLLWFVAHTQSRCEKKVFQHCEREDLAAIVPSYRAVHKYRGKTVVFQKPLFPSYVILRIRPEQRNKIYQSDHVANLLEVADQDLFERQLSEVMRALETDLEIRLAPAIGNGMRVNIKNGPLQGVEGWVEERYGADTVLLRLDFIGQAVAVKVQAGDLELI